VVRRAWLLTTNWASAEDLVQTVLFDAWRRWDHVAAATDPHAYLMKCLFHAAINSRRRRWNKELPTSDIDDRAIPDGSAEADLRHTLALALRSLPPRQRAIVVLRYYEDLSDGQIAALLNCSVGNVKSQCSRALRKLRSANLLASEHTRVGRHE
jgi:RNA polymerase sigma-70 factor (sigma-E family)